MNRSHPFFHFSLPVCLLGLLSGTAAAENGFDDWHIYGANTARATLYEVHGSGAASPYPFEGDMYYDELNLYFSKRDSNYDFWRGEFSGLYNINDEYRAGENGIIAERVNLTRESGSGAVPYRLEMGDYFAYFSYLTLQRSLKGARWEMQPHSDTAGRRHSIVLLSGMDQPYWYDLDPADNYTNAFSWLVEDRALGAWGLNFAHNYRQASPTLGLLDRNQMVFSLAGEKPFTLGTQNLILEAELARFQGDHNGIVTAADGQGVSDPGAYMQLSGISQLMPWDYQLRMQYYGQDYRPSGGVITPDRRSVEAFSGWRFDSGVLMRLRAQRFEDRFESLNPLDTRTVGVNFTGPLLSRFAPDVSGSLDAFIQNRDDALNTTSQLSQTANLNLLKPLPLGWSGRLNLFLQNIEDTGTLNADLMVRELRLSADHIFHFAGFTGYITPGILARTLRRNATDSNDLNPTLAVQLARGPHTLRADYGYLSQNRLLAANDQDLDTYMLNLDYTYTRREHVFGFEANLFSRSPEPGPFTDAYRVSVYWTYHFDRPPVGGAAAGGTAVVPTAATAAPGLAVAELVPGLPSQVVERALENAAAGPGIRQGEFLVYDYPVYRDILRRQRLVLEYLANELQRSAVIIDFDDVGDPQTALQTFERVRQILIRRLGTPTRSYDEGDFSASFVTDVNSQRLLRLVEWQTDTGSIIRFGMPRRLDGRVRMEIQHARSFPPPSETRWSLEAVR